MNATRQLPMSLEATLADICRIRQRRLLPMSPQRVVGLRSVRLGFARLRQSRLPDALGCHSERSEESLSSPVRFRFHLPHTAAASRRARLSALIPHPFFNEHPPSKPAEFIEVKPPGKADDGYNFYRLSSHFSHVP
jgi:hypothetical protein